jgi:hypothetical protein
VSILAQVIESLRVDIAAQSIPLLNIKLASVGDVTLNVSITGTPTVNIQTSGGANIVIDKLTQGAYTERQSTLANNGAEATMLLSNLMYKRGKFFPRGCRGFIRSIEIYCDNADTASHTFTIKISPMPGMGPVATFTLSVAAGLSAAWRSVTVRRFWNYDSLFIWVSSDSDSYGGLGYDAGEPYDFYNSTDEVSWFFGNYRFWFRVNMAGETVGDLPVSGTVNTVEIPGLVTARQFTELVVPAGSEKYDVVQVGAGEVLYVWFWVGSVGDRNYLFPKVKCDGVSVLPGDFSFYHYYAQFVSDSTPGIAIGKWDTTNNYYCLVVAVPFSFTRTLEVGFKNGDSASSHTGYVMYAYKKIS